MLRSGACVFFYETHIKVVTSTTIWQVALDPQFAAAEFRMKSTPTGQSLLPCSAHIIYGGAAGLWLPQCCLLHKIKTRAAGLWRVLSNIFFYVECIWVYNPCVRSSVVVPTLPAITCGSDGACVIAVACLLMRRVKQPLMMSLLYTANLQSVTQRCCLEWFYNAPVKHLVLVSSCCLLWRLLYISI